MDKLPQISEAEYEIMKIIWDESPISTNSICEKVPSIHNWSNKTVHTLLSSLLSNAQLSDSDLKNMCHLIDSKLNGGDET
ncbi:BlaI/MecI/CopY family transcriptional regulator [Mediterraneibacter gnavus]|uniref:BlaI/MecI/CopY family transcriptional regulator n=1 Tax=Mediterraneibacter gnavus TaxID=33038 RepID=UPI0040690B08